jgi:hypothetical protein
VFWGERVGARALYFTVVLPVDDKEEADLQTVVAPGTGLQVSFDPGLPSEQEQRFAGEAGRPAGDLASSMAHRPEISAPLSGMEAPWLAWLPPMARLWLEGGVTGVERGGVARCICGGGVNLSA